MEEAQPALTTVQQEQLVTPFGVVAAGREEAPMEVLLAAMVERAGDLEVEQVAVVPVTVRETPVMVVMAQMVQSISLPGKLSHMRVHLISLPHTQTTSEYVSCAYTMKLLKFCKMMKPLGYEVILYSGEENEADSFEHVPVVKKREVRKWFGAPDLQNFYPITWSPNDVHWTTMNKRAVREIKKRRASERDLVLLIAGTCQQQIAAGLPDMISCEWGVGYEGIFANFCAFESHAWRHYIYGKRGMVDGRWYDATIPNFFDRDDFYTVPKKEKGDYLLFMGRIVTRKGPHIAAQIAERLGMKLIVAGQGGRIEDGVLRSNEIVVGGSQVEYMGAVDAAVRADLMAHAVATIVPTIYIEPFGGVAVESMFAGTPAITSDWGAFSETVEPGVTGERFRTLAEGVEAVQRARKLNSEKIRARALDRFSIEAVAPQFDSWFNQLLGLWGKGWDA